MMTPFAAWMQSRSASLTNDRSRWRSRMRYQEQVRETELDQLSDETELDTPDRRALDDAVL